MIPSPIVAGSSPYPTAWWFGRDDRDCLPVFESQLDERPLYPFPGTDLSSPFRAYRWARLKQTKAGLHVTWDVAESNPGGVEAIRDILRSNRACFRVYLNYFWAGAWSREILEDSKQAADRIDDISRFSRVNLFSPALMTSAPPDCRDRAPDLVQRCWDWWESGDRRALPSNDDLAAQCSVFTPDEDGRFALDYVGERSSLAVVFGRNWARQSRAERQIPDSSYDDAVSEPYRAVVETREPRRDHVVAAIQTWAFPEPIWISYERLLLPTIGTGAASSSSGNAVTCVTSIVSRNCASIMLAMSA
ncbi:MAG: hypothetical protein MI920_21890 [Kiloniellales bacterium]|nr:hypothetical protein [Kiloniellales bacterium]